MVFWGEGENVLAESVSEEPESSGQVSSNFMKWLRGYSDFEKECLHIWGKKVLRFYSATFKIYGGGFKPLMSTYDLNNG